jgi:hypothetical protein
MVPAVASRRQTATSKSTIAMAALAWWAEADAPLPNDHGLVDFGQARLYPRRSPPAEHFGHRQRYNRTG